jgi:hypothetical protein
MFQPLRTVGLLCLGLFLLLLEGVQPEAAAQPLIIRSFRNDTGMPIFMQGATQIKGVLVKGRLVPMGVVAPSNLIREPMPPTPTMVYIFDAQQRLLYSTTIVPAATEQLYSVQMDAPLILPNGTVVPRAKLVLIKPRQG